VAEIQEYLEFGDGRNEKIIAVVSPIPKTIGFKLDRVVWLYGSQKLKLRAVPLTSF